jgi:exonuclease III
MIVSSYNIRGLGGVLKRRNIKELIRRHRIDFLALQETKMEEISDSFCQALWGNDCCDWVFLPAVGNSGGLLSLWNKEKASKVFHFTGEGFIGVCV